MTDYSSIPQVLKDIPNWVCVKKNSKAPWMATEPTPASTANRNTWSTFEQAQASVLAGNYDDIGFVFDSVSGIVGIDIDDGWTEEGTMTDLAWDIINTCHSYTEMSRSGRGFHILLKGQLGFRGKNNQHGVQIYQDGRYFIMTGCNLLQTEIRTDTGEIARILEKYFPQTVRTGESQHRNIPTGWKPLWSVSTEGRIQVIPKFPNVLSPGNRNQSLLSWAGVLLQAGMCRQMMLDELKRVNVDYCNPCLPQFELKSIVRSIMRYKR